MNRAVVVEDDPHNAILFRKLLEKRLGLAVTVTEDPAEMFAALEQGGVALIVMDVSLRSSSWEGRAVSGVDLCRLLKASPRWAGVPVMLATAHAMRGDATRLLDASGADRYVSKPIVDHGDFIACVRELIREAA